MAYAQPYSTIPAVAGGTAPARDPAEAMPEDRTHVRDQERRKDGRVMSNDDTTQDGPPLACGRRNDLYAVLVEALEEAQRASNQLLGAVWRSPEDVVIAAHDACACWRIAEWTFRRVAVRIRMAPAPTNAAKDQLQQAASALDITHHTLNERLVVALLLPPADDSAARRELEQLQHDFAIALRRGGADT
jgi:hypothetical protein